MVFGNEMMGIDARLAGSLDVFGQVVDKEAILPGDTQFIQRMTVDVGMGFAHSDFVGEKKAVRSV